MRVPVENTAGMSRGREWKEGRKEGNVVGEVPSGSCAVEGGS